MGRQPDLQKKCKGRTCARSCVTSHRVHTPWISLQIKARNVPEPLEPRGPFLPPARLPSAGGGSSPTLQVTTRAESRSPCCAAGRLGAAVWGVRRGSPWAALPSRLGAGGRAGSGLHGGAGGVPASAKFWLKVWAPLSVLAQGDSWVRVWVWLGSCL